jgi:hypothetical protein
MAATTIFEDAQIETDKEGEGGEVGEVGEVGEKKRVETQQHLELRQQQQEQADEEESDDLDMFIDELESQASLYEEEEEEELRHVRIVSEEFLQTNTSVGLTATEVLLRRQKFGLNYADHEENVIFGLQRSLVHPIQLFIGVCVLIVWWIWCPRSHC